MAVAPLEPAGGTAALGDTLTRRRWGGAAEGSRGAGHPEGEATTLTIAATALGCSRLALLGLMAAGWFGRELVFRWGWRGTPAAYDQEREEDLRPTSAPERMRQSQHLVRE